MFALCWFVLSVLASPFKSKSRLEAENAALRHQLIVLCRKVPGRVRLTNNDRWFFIQLYRWFPLIRQMSMENPLWGAPRIHGELLKLGYEVAQSTRSLADFTTTTCGFRFSVHTPGQSRPVAREAAERRCFPHWLTSRGTAPADNPACRRDWRGTVSDRMSRTGSRSDRS